MGRSWQGEAGLRPLNALYPAPSFFLSSAHCILCPPDVAAAAAARAAVEAEESARALSLARCDDVLASSAGHSQNQPDRMSWLQIASERLRDQAYILQSDKTFEIVTVAMIILFSTPLTWASFGEVKVALR